MNDVRGYERVKWERQNLIVNVKINKGKNIKKKQANLWASTHLDINLGSITLKFTLGPSATSCLSTILCLVLYKLHMVIHTICKINNIKQSNKKIVQEL